MIYKNIDSLVGNTPLLEIENIEQKENLYARVLVKLEYFNPAGSAKDRIAVAMIEAAEEAGLLKQGSTIIEPTSGNTGIGIAMVVKKNNVDDVLSFAKRSKIAIRVIGEIVNG